jgi:signal transduction histidine kinase
MTVRPGPSAGDVLRHAPAAVAVIDGAGVFTDANPQAAELCQMSRSALVGMGEDDVDFLVTMAEQAARAVDRARLLQREREVARREARQELARDLHDSVVQQVFSLMMQARSVSLLAGRGLPPPPERLAQVADELGTAAQDALTDLRGMVVELRPATGENGGLVPALRSLLDATAARTGLVVSLEDGGDGDQFTALDPDLVEDVYRVLAEAVHNVVKHASASRVEVRIRVTSWPDMRSGATRGGGW